MIKGKHSLVITLGIIIITAVFFIVSLTSLYFYATSEIIITKIFDLILLSIVLALTLFIAIHSTLGRPLIKIIAALQNQDDDGIPIKPMPHHGVSEITLLADTINRMLHSIKNSRVKLNKQKRELRYQATHDTLSSLANRTLFNDRLQQALVKSKRNGLTVALLFIDLDHFKEINDSLGHKVGDKVLQVVSRRLRKTIREEDTLSRLGGDEFAIIMENIIQAESASKLASKILTELSEVISINNNELYIGSSIGISLSPDNSTNLDDLIKFADAAMYKAKDEGRNNFQYYSKEMTELAVKRVAMESALRTAIKNDEFIPYYQPQIDGKTGRLIGLEVLVRWQQVNNKLVSPADFIPIAESTGLIVNLDRLVMKHAMKQMALWYQQGLNPGVLSVNLSMKQLEQSDFLEHLNKLIDETGCQAKWLTLEVTESQLMKDPENAITILKKISHTGITLAVDDFGTGYSSLSYLKKLPINKLKIDQSFVQLLPNDKDDIAITQAVISLGNSLNMQLIAEGVETAEQKNFLLKNGCRVLQGYYYAKPMPANELADRWLQPHIN